MQWTDINIGGKRAAFYDTGEKRLYVCQHFGKTEAWIGSSKIGNFESLDAAKAAAEIAVGIRKAPKPVGVFATPDPRKYTAPVKREVPHRPRIDSREDLLKQFPIADPEAPTELDKLQKATDLRKEVSPVIVAIDPAASHAVAAGHCSCGARLGRSGKCPALCETVTGEAPVYDGPRFVGKTHTARLGAPVTW